MADTQIPQQVESFNKGPKSQDEMPARKKARKNLPAPRTLACASHADRSRQAGANGYAPPNLGKAIRLTVPDFSDPGRPPVCLEVDFPIVPINALSALEVKQATTKNPFTLCLNGGLDGNPASFEAC